MSRPKAIATGVLEFGGVVADVYVLDDGRRVISKRGQTSALIGAAGKGDIGRFLGRLPKRFASLTAPPEIVFSMPSGGIAHGREGGWFVEVCDAYVDALVAGELHPRQMHLAANARRVLSAVAKVGIVALIDEATQYQRVRADRALNEYFERILRQSPDVWERVWAPDVLLPLCAVFRAPYKMGGKVPGSIAGGVIPKIYVLVFGIEALGRMRDLNPPRSERDDDAPDRDIHTQWLTPEAKRALLDVMPMIRAIAYACIDSGKESFWRALERSLGRRLPPDVDREIEAQLTMWRLFGEDAAE